MTRILAVAAVAAIAVASGASAHEYQLRALRIDHPFARATPPGARSGGVFLSVENKGDRTDRLLTVSTPVAGAYHVMLTDLKRPLQAGETFPLTLGFEKAGSIKVDVEVESMAGGAMHPHTVR
jgi:hypothetical protein